ncbi:hypothetical protein ES677_14515 [Bizionia gelidisalsuginis]|uniref:DUF6705 domain-containing protein n=1 Tax=Bizionia gelidisalsuginis TaxID=291188 RepID=A0ABY3M720_9FLAO|nr:DUF6705 family protein [Bizionia gelidisalsuginis]TYC08418.1 hypothetical protein ES677_14515 [Bizionia gelidisalsuginis]
MKNTIFILIILLALSCKAQINSSNQGLEIPIEQHLNILNSNIENGIPDGAYLKDVNNLFNDYLGVWQGTVNNEAIEFLIYKVVYNSSIRPLTIDKLYIKYKITEANGNVVIETSSLQNEDGLIIKGNYFGHDDSYYVLDYSGEHYSCGQMGTIFVKLINNNTQIRVHYNPNTDSLDVNNCPNGESVSQVLVPEFILTKQ